MLNRSSRSRSSADVASLVLCAQSAGAAWACSYSTSAEYDAALIAERRAAGIYGPRRQRKQLFLTLAGLGAGIGVIMLVISAIA